MNSVIYIVIMMIIGVAIGVATMCLGQAYYEGRFKELMPEVKLYGMVQMLIPTVAAGLFAWYGYDVLKVAELTILLAVLILGGKIDKHTRIIPNILVVVLFAQKIFFLVCRFAFDKEQFAQDVVYGISGLLVMLVTFTLVRTIYKQSIGMGDIKLMVALGFNLGIMRSMYILLVASVVAVFGTVVGMARKKVNAKDSFSFGPSSAFGGALVLILGI